MTPPARPPAWVAETVFYQIFPDRFARSARSSAPGPLEPWDTPPTLHGFKGGDLQGIVDRLDYLADLGTSALYLNPIFSSAANHRYHPFDYFEVDPLLGGQAAFDALIRSAHARGMRVILDGVFNHTGRGFWAFHHVMENGRHSPYRDWFHFDQDRLDRGELPGAYPDAALAVPRVAEWEHQASAAEPSMERLGYRAWWDLPALPKLNVANPHVREHLLSAAEHWIRAGADGWRLDVPEEIDDTGFWYEFRQRVKSANPEAYLVGEIWHVRPDWCSAERFDALMNYPLAEAILGYVAGDYLDWQVVKQHHELAEMVRRDDGAAFAQRLEELLGAYDPAVSAAQLNLLGSHDTPRLLTVCGGDTRSVELAFLLLMTLPGAPSIYYGDEIGMEGGMDPECRAAFPWEARETWNDRLRDLARTLIRMRHNEPALREAPVQRLGESGDACAYLRSGQDAELLVTVNAGRTAASLPLPRSAVGWDPEVVVGTAPRIEGSQLVSVPARSGALFRGAPPPAP